MLAHHIRHILIRHILRGILNNSRAASSAGIVAHTTQESGHIVETELTIVREHREKYSRESPASQEK